MEMAIAMEINKGFFMKASVERRSHECQEWHKPYHPSNKAISRAISYIV
jgi:hypothetical protein